MTDKKDGGPAFPVVAEGGVDSGLHPTFNAGMSLRDYFAGQALAGLVARSGGAYDLRAVEAYAIADAMLAARGSDE